MLSTVFFVLLFSKGINEYQPKIDQTSYCVKSKQINSKLDHALIEYNDMTYSIFSNITYYPKKVYLISDGFHINNKKIVDSDTIKTIQSYLQQFYVDESEKIELKRTKTEGPITGEYSSIKVTLYFKNGETEVFSNTIGSEDYIIEYNPKFLSFIQYIEKIVKS